MTASTLKCEECGKDATIVIRDVVVEKDLLFGWPVWQLQEEHALCEEHKRLSFILTSTGRQRGHVNEYGYPVLYPWEGAM